MEINRSENAAKDMKAHVDKSIERATKEEEASVLETGKQINKEDSIPYISMKKENIGIFKGNIQKVGDDYVLLFDIDDTLYKSSEKFHQNQIKSFYEAYDKLRAQFLPFNKDIPEVGVALKENALYTQTFFKYFDISPIQLEKFREQCDYRDFIERDDRLREFLLNLPFRKWAFTNGLRSRAEPILEVLGLSDCFEGVICFDDDSRDIIGKPMKEAFEFVENLLEIENKSKVFFFDDHHLNIQTGNLFGWKSILVKKEDDLIDLINDAIGNIKFN